MGINAGKGVKMKESTYYNYKELVEKATATGATRDDRLALLEWFNCYGKDYWNGEYYEMDDGLRLYPVAVFDYDEGYFTDVDADIRY